jgi:hypothetical protein
MAIWAPVTTDLVSSNCSSIDNCLSTAPGFDHRQSQCKMGQINSAANDEGEKVREALDLLIPLASRRWQTCVELRPAGRPQMSLRPDTGGEFR